MYRCLNCFIILFIVLNLFSCRNKDKLLQNSDRVLKLYNWEDYIGSDTIEGFTRETGIIVQLDTYDDEEKMFAEIRSNLSSYDLVIASDSLIREMILTKSLHQIDYEKLENVGNIDERYLNLDFDEYNQFSIPYLWGTSGIVVNRKYVENSDWSVLFNNKYKDKVALLNNSYEVFAVALKYLGKGINPKNRRDIESAANLLAEQKKYGKGYLDAISIVDLLVEEEVWVAQIYSGEGLTAVDQNENLEYLLPEDGAAIWLDSFVIPRDAENVNEAHKFIDYVLRAEVAGKLSSELWYATPNRAAKEFVEYEVLSSETVYPSDEVLRRCEYFTDIGELSPYLSEKWSELNKK